MVICTKQTLRRRAKLALGYLLVAMMAFQGVGTGFAQTKKLPKALLPGPGNLGIQLSLLGRGPGRTVVSSNQHPLFESSWTGLSDEVIARTRYGNVTSADLYLWMMLRESPNRAFLLDLYQDAKMPEDRKELAKGLKVEIDEYVFTNLVIPRLMPAAPPDATYDFKHYVYTLPAWQSVYLQRVVAPSVTIREADRQKFLQEHAKDMVEPERLRVRYIFKKSAETDDIDVQDDLEATLNGIRADVLAGRVKFEDAARQHSEAPSAKRGGEVPPFQHGELFFRFEYAAAELEPGGVSEVFRGPGGYYLVQLLEVVQPEEPSLSNPRQAKLVEEGVSRQVLKAAFDIRMRDMLEERRRLTEKPWAWDSLEEHEVVGEVCDFQVTKSQFRSAWPGIETNDLKLRGDVISQQLRVLLEREAMAQEVRDLGLANDPMLERARVMAGNIIRRDAWVEQLRGTLPISEEMVYDFYKKNPDLFKPLALKRVTRLTMRPSNTAPLPAQTRMEMEKVLADAAGIAPPVQVKKRQLLDEERDGPVHDTLARTQQAFDMMANPTFEEILATNDAFSTAALRSLIESEPLDVPSLDGAPAPGLETIEAPAEVPKTTIESLEDRSSESETLDLSTTAPQGGAPPAPAAGGSAAPAETVADVTPADPNDALLPNVATRPVRKIYGEDNGEGEPVSRAPISSAKTHVGTIKPAARPTGGAAPVGVPGPLVQPTPNVRKQLQPPPTSSIPYNPDWFYERLDFTRIREVVGEYASSDWLLSMDDMGFVYLEDHPEIPRRVEKVPVGAFTRPIIDGQNAVSWYIEDARTTEAEPFEQIKTHVYDVYRETQIDKAVSRTYNAELEKANIDYRF